MQYSWIQGKRHNGCSQNDTSGHMTFFNWQISIMDTITYFKIKKMSPQLLVADVDRSIEFYTKKLGFDVEFRYEDFYAGIIKDGYSIHLKASKPSIEERENRRKD